MAANEVSVNIKTKNTFKYDYFPDFYFRKMHNLQIIETPKKARNKARTKLSVNARMLKTLTRSLRS